MAGDSSQRDRCIKLSSASALLFHDDRCGNRRAGDNRGGPHKALPRLLSLQLNQISYGGDARVTSASPNIGPSEPTCRRRFEEEQHMRAEQPSPHYAAPENTLPRGRT